MAPVIEMELSYRCWVDVAGWGLRFVYFHPPLAPRLKLLYSIKHGQRGAVRQTKEIEMTQFANTLKSALDFADATLPSDAKSVGTIFRPAQNRKHILAAREGLLMAAVIEGICEARCASPTIDDFLRETMHTISQKSSDEIYAERAEGNLLSSDDVMSFAKSVISNYGSADGFVKHAIACGLLGDGDD